MSSTTPVLLNKAGLFNSTRWQVLLYGSGLAALHEGFRAQEAEDAASAKALSAAAAKLRTEQREVLGLLDSLPRVTRSDTAPYGHYQLNGCLARPNPVDDTLVCVPVLVGNFLTAMSRGLVIEQVWHDDPEQWGLPIVRGLVARQKALQALAKDAFERIPEAQRPKSDEYVRYEKSHALTPTAKPGVYQFVRNHRTGYRHDTGEISLALPSLLDPNALKAAKRLADLIEKSEAVVRPESAVDNLSFAHAFAIYSGSGANAGYLDGRDNFVDAVGGARLFVSAKSAETTIRSRTLRDAAVVALDVQVTGMAPGHSPTHFEKLAEVVADLNRRKLLDLVAKARGDDLLELEAQVAQRRAELEAAGVIPKGVPLAQQVEQEREKEEERPRRSM